MIKRGSHGWKNSGRVDVIEGAFTAKITMVVLLAVRWLVMGNARWKPGDGQDTKKGAEDVGKSVFDNEGA
ncbi:hypothetical protein M3588_07025 [Cytobacillus sp. AMY 15.2]|nr:hypothetical protein [Cytobacillus sp. AMY 15.2]